MTYITKCCSHLIWRKLFDLDIYGTSMAYVIYHLLFVGLTSLCASFQSRWSICCGGFTVASRWTVSSLDRSARRVPNVSPTLSCMLSICSVHGGISSAVAQGNNLHIVVTPSLPLVPSSYRPQPLVVAFTHCVPSELGRTHSHWGNPFAFIFCKV